MAKRVDLCAVTAHLGYTVKRIGKYHTLKEMDSIRIYDRSHWFRWSRQFDRGNNGGSKIDFLRVFAGMEVKEAVFWLLDFAGYQRKTGEPVNLKHQVKAKEQEKKAFVLPKAAKTNAYLYDYLTKERGIRREVVSYFERQNLIYESQPYHNIVFLGNDKNYGFHVANEASCEIVVFEAAIDLMSFVDIFNDVEKNKLALGMLSDAPLERFLEEHPQITDIIFCLDNDEPGRKAAAELMKKYAKRGYGTQNLPPPEGYKDYNEWLVKARQKIQNVRADGYMDKVHAK